MLYQCTLYDHLVLPLFRQDGIMHTGIAALSGYAVVFVVDSYRSTPLYMILPILISVIAIIGFCNYPSTRKALNVGLIAPAPQMTPQQVTALRVGGEGLGVAKSERIREKCEEEKNDRGIRDTAGMPNATHSSPKRTRTRRPVPAKLKSRRASVQQGMELVEEMQCLEGTKVQRSVEVRAAEASGRSLVERFTHSTRSTEVNEIVQRRGGQLETFDLVDNDDSALDAEIDEYIEQTLRDGRERREKMTPTLDEEIDEYIQQTLTDGRERRAKIAHFFDNLHIK